MEGPESACSLGITKKPILTKPPVLQRLISLARSLSAAHLSRLFTAWAQFPFLQKRGTMSDPSDNPALRQQIPWLRLTADGAELMVRVKERWESFEV